MSIECLSEAQEFSSCRNSVPSFPMVDTSHSLDKLILKKTFLTPDRVHISNKLDDSSNYKHWSQDTAAETIGGEFSSSPDSVRFLQTLSMYELPLDSSHSPKNQNSASLQNLLSSRTRTTRITIEPKRPISNMDVYPQGLSPSKYASSPDRCGMGSGTKDYKIELETKLNVFYKPPAKSLKSIMKPISLLSSPLPSLTKIKEVNFGALEEKETVSDKEASVSPTIPSTKIQAAHSGPKELKILEPVSQQITKAKINTNHMSASCSICKGYIKENTHLACGHSFCKGCIKKFLINCIQKNRFPVPCPETNCSKPVKTTDVWRLVPVPEFRAYEKQTNIPVSNVPNTQKDDVKRCARSFCIKNNVKAPAAFRASQA